MAASSWCLKRCEEQINEVPHIPLPPGQEVTVGRGLDVKVQLLSLGISRLHATFQECQDNKWIVKDHNSANGTYVNGKRVKNNKELVLQEGDLIQLGRPANKETPPEFVYKLVKEEHTEDEVKAVFNRAKKKKPPKQTNGVKRTHSESNNNANDKDNKNVNDEVTTNKDAQRNGAKRVKLNDSQEAGPSGGQHCNAESPRRKETVLPRAHLSEKQVEEMKAKLQEQEVVAEKRIQKAEQQLEDMQLVLAANECAKEQLEEKLKLREQEMLKELELHKEKLQAEKDLLQRQMKEFTEKQLREKEEKLLSELKQQKESLMEEKRKVEESLQKELQTKLEEKDKTLQAELEKEKEKLEDVISRKELEYAALEHQLQESKLDQEKQTLVIQKAKEEAIQNVADVMEDELQCSLCYELFVQATTLNCSHSFCYWCITEWSETKKNNNCPVCRVKITSKNKSIVLDSYIDKMVENLSDEHKKGRTEVVAERMRLLEERSGGKKKTSPRKQAGRSNAGVGGGGGSTSGGTGSGTGTGPAAGTRSHTINIIQVISEDEEGNDDDDDELDYNSDVYDDSPISISSTYDSENDDDESSVEGDFGAYYGGYGHCYHCGRRGHWANGCPMRF
ncbi:E3 ubiquitin-protein ligase RNF8-like [Ptychodera flava]|uniref:E3 ubiquitin-protein ligase RNF8-like n=1 Tax=Ptychodera flava TaxID=63121 RepID=UPI00396A13B8